MTPHNIFIRGDIQILKLYMTMTPAPLRKLLDEVCEVIRLEHYSYRTDQNYLDWIRRYLRYHQCGLWLVNVSSNSITKAD